MNTCFLRSELLASHGVTAIFSLRHGGVSHPPFDSLNLGSGLGDNEENIAHNMNMLIRESGLPSIPHRAKQVHGTDVLVCRKHGIMHRDKADILIGINGAATGIRVADCVPVLLADPETKLVAAVHAGWRGTAAQAVMHAISAMQQHGAKPAQMFASVGPCIGPCCFEIDVRTANTLSRCVNDAHRYIHHADNRTHANLAAINVQQLQYAGIPETHIEQISACTCCDKNRFYSWRRDGRQAGRHLAVVALPDAP